eukprot:scaffold157239_cov25-Prasinocladus_malaysianus.AAC.1
MEANATLIGTANLVQKGFRKTVSFLRQSNSRTAIVAMTLLRYSYSYVARSGRHTGTLTRTSTCPVYMAI